MKLVHETHKILEDFSIGITATAIRIPVIGGHSESVNIEFESNYDIKKIKSILDETNGVEVVDDPNRNFYPMPINVEEKMKFCWPYKEG